MRGARHFCSKSRAQRHLLGWRGGGTLDVCKEHPSITRADTHDTVPSVEKREDFFFVTHRVEGSRRVRAPGAAGARELLRLPCLLTKPQVPINRF